MAYRRKQGGSPPPPDISTATSSLAAKAIRASSAYSNNSLSSANYSFSHNPSSPPPEDSTNCEYTSMKNLEPKQGFWGVLARKAKSILDDDNDDDDTNQHVESPRRTRLQMSDTSRRTKLQISDTPSRRQVAMAMAAKAKLLLRELKTIKADLAFAKERCAQLEEENRILRESHEKGDNPEDDDLGEKAAIHKERDLLSNYAREWTMWQ